MSVRNHHNPFLRERERQDRERRANARKNPRAPKRTESSRAKLARELFNETLYV